MVGDLGGVTGDAPEPLPAAERWEAFEGLLAAYVPMEHRQAVSDALYEPEAAIREWRRPRDEDVTAAREALDHARALLMEHYAPLATDAEPWGEGAGRTVPHGVPRKQLERAGYECRYD